MSKATANTPTLTGNFSDVISFLARPDGDEADQLAQRAIFVMLATNLSQTGEEVDTDPFVANMFAHSALLTLSDHLKHYPFVRAPRPLGWNDSGSMSGFADDAAVIESVRHLVESAERMLAQPEPEPITELDFFAIGQGGTDFAGAFEAALRIIDADQAASPYNRYVFVIIDDEVL
jgi:hypothetical protein